MLPWEHGEWHIRKSYILQLRQCSQSNSGFDDDAAFCQHGKISILFRDVSSSVDTVPNAPTIIGSTATFTFQSFWIVINEQILIIYFSYVSLIPSWFNFLARGKGKLVIKHPLFSLYITITSGLWCYITLSVFVGKFHKILQCLFSITDSSPVSTICLYKLGSKSCIRTNESFFPVCYDTFVTDFVYWSHFQFSLCKENSFVNVFIDLCS